MKEISKHIFYILLTIFLSACGTGKFLGFEEKKIPLEGKRVSVLKDIKGVTKDNFSLSKIILTSLLDSENWQQSYNSPSHISLNYRSNSSYQKFYKVISGKGESSDEIILSQPIVSNNHLFFLDAKSNVYAYDILKKKLIWKKNITMSKDKGHSIGGGVAADDQYLFVGSPYAEVICIEIQSGKVIWVKERQTPVRATPTLIENKVIILTLDNRTLVFDKTDGLLLWEHQGIQNSTSIVGQPKVAVEGNLVLAPYSNGEIFALNLTNGSEIWRQSSLNIEQSETSNSFSDIDANPVILKNLIIIASTNGKIFAFNKKNGNQIWQQFLNTTQTPLVNGNSIYVIHNNKEMVNLDLNNGKIRWIAQIKNFSNIEANNNWLSPVLINNKIVLVGGNKEMIILNPYTGGLEGKYKLPSMPASAPIIVKQDIFLMFKNGSIFGIK